MDIQLVVLSQFGVGVAPCQHIWDELQSWNCWLKTPAVDAPEEPDTPDQFENTMVTNMNPGFPTSLPVSYVAFEYPKPS
jgi:hypothetical protein